MFKMPPNNSSSFEHSYHSYINNINLRQEAAPFTELKLNSVLQELPMKTETFHHKKDPA